MNINDEFLTDAYTSLGLLRAAKKSLEEASPQSPVARPIWHEALKLVERAISEQWKYTDHCVAQMFPTEKPENQR